MTNTAIIPHTPAVAPEIVQNLPVQDSVQSHIRGYDPEMLFVECARCGNPILWEQGKTTRILEGAGIDALELDPQCMLVAGGCPRCSQGGVYHVQIVRVQSGPGHANMGRTQGNA